LIYSSGKVIAFSTLEDALQDELVHVVVVASPSGTHYEIAKKSLQKMKHVIVGKWVNILT